jgi:hypothetical protein
MVKYNVVGARGVFQTVECLPSKHKSLSSSPVPKRQRKGKCLYNGVLFTYKEENIMSFAGKQMELEPTTLSGTL